MPIARLSPRIASFPTADSGHRISPPRIRRGAWASRGATLSRKPSAIAPLFVPQRARLHRAIAMGRTIFGKIRSGRPPERLTGALRFRAGDAAFGMIVDEPHRLHEGMDRGGADERPAALLQIL